MQNSKNEIRHFKIEWHCQLLKPEDRSNLDKWERWEPEKPTLLVLDYMFGFEEVLQHILLRMQHPLEHKVRLLVLDHVLETPLEQDKIWGLSQNQTSLDITRNLFYKNEALLLLESSQNDVVKAVVQKVSGLNNDDPRISEAILYLEKTKGAWQPLFGALLGNTIKAGKEYQSWNRRELIAYYLKGERYLWEGDDSSKLAACFIAVATARRGISYDDLIAHTINSSSHNLKIDDYDDVIERCQSIVSNLSQNVLSPLEPDLLGESFFLLFLNKLRRLTLQKFFFELLTLGTETQLESDTNEFLGFTDRLIENLSAEEFGSNENSQLWDSVWYFFNLNNFQQCKLLQWAVNCQFIGTANYFAKLNCDEKSKTAFSLFSPNINYSLNNVSLNEKSTRLLLAYLELGLLNSIVDNDAFNTEIDKIIKYYTDHDSYPLIFMCCEWGFINVIKASNFLQKQINVELYGKNTPLIYSVLLRRKEAVKVLCDLGANVNYRDDEDCSALDAALAVKDLVIIDLLKNYNLNLNAQSNHLSTALIVQTSNENYHLVEYLCEAGADTNIQDEDGKSAIMYAAQAGNDELVELLIKHGADPNLKDNYGYNALIYAISENSYETVKLLYPKASSPKLNTQSKDGVSPLITASLKEKTIILKDLLDLGADVNLQLNNGLTALMIATNKQDLNQVKVLMCHPKIDFEIEENSFGFTALSYAALRGSYDIFRFLHKKGANLFHKDKNGLSIQDLANKSSNKKIVEYIRTYNEH